MALCSVLYVRSRGCFSSSADYGLHRVLTDTVISENGTNIHFYGFGRTKSLLHVMLPA